MVETSLNEVSAFTQKYPYDSKHCQRVAVLTLQLFDQLKPLHFLGERDRFLLQIGALLHDLGRKEGVRKHHKIAQEIILNLPFTALSDEEKTIVALVARYHRRSLPKESHPLYASLPQPIKEEVKKLAAFLRIADGLDRSHLGLVKEIKACISGNKVTIEIIAKNFSQMDKEAAQIKADLFEQTYQKKVEIRWKRNGFFF